VQTGSQLDTVSPRCAPPPRESGRRRDPGLLGLLTSNGQRLWAFAWKTKCRSSSESQEDLRTASRNRDAVGCARTGGAGQPNPRVVAAALEIRGYRKLISRGIASKWVHHAFSCLRHRPPFSHGLAGATRSRCRQKCGFGCLAIGRARMIDVRRLVATLRAVNCRAVGEANRYVSSSSSEHSTNLPRGCRRPA
jgi:hypothetical protein